MHDHAHDIAEKCVKLFGKPDGEDGEDGEGAAGDGKDNKDGEGDGVEKLMKAEALNQSLSKALGDTNALVADLQKRLEHMEKQPAVLKGALFEANRGHEVQAGEEPAEASKASGMSALGLPPEVQRAMLFGR